MPPDPFLTSRSITASATLVLFNREVELELTAPVARVQFREILPLVRDITNLVVQVALDEARDQGIAISCRKGCGACCIQAVPLAPAEARAISDLVKALPEPRQTQIRERFSTGLAVASEAGLLNTLMDTGELDDAESVFKLGMDYLRLQIPCPFLEDQACSIHPERPIRCREYLVTSSPEFCAGPRPQEVTRLRIPAQAFRSMLSVGGEWTHDKARWVPLIAALEWAQANPDNSLPRPGADIVREFFEALSGVRLPAPDVNLY